MAKKQSFQPVLLPASSKTLLHVHYLREPNRRAVILRWPRAKFPPQPDGLTKSEWTRLTGLLLKFCESGYKAKANEAAK